MTFEQTLKKMEKTSHEIVTDLSGKHSEGQIMMILAITLDGLLSVADEEKRKEFQQVQQIMRDQGVLKWV